MVWRNNASSIIENIAIEYLEPQLQNNEEKCAVIARGAGGAGGSGGAGGAGGAGISIHETDCSASHKFLCQKRCFEENVCK